MSWLDALRDAFTPTSHTKEPRNRRDADRGLPALADDPQSDELLQDVRKELRNVQLTLAQLGVEVELATERKLEEIEREFRAGLAEERHGV